MKIPKIIKLPSGSWFCQLRIDGNSVSITDDDYDTVLAKAYAYKTGLLKMRKKPQDITLKDACTKYIEGRKSRLSPSSIQGYEKIRDQHFQTLMNQKLSSITLEKIDKAVEYESSKISRRNKPLAPKTIKNAYIFLVSVLKAYVPDLNPHTRLPEVKQKIIQILPPEKIYPAIKETSIELPCLLAMWLSLSMSEIRGITKSNSIFENKLIIKETVITVKGKDVRKEGGKEEKRTRTHDIPPYIKTLIDQVDGDILVPLSGDAIYRRFQRLLKKAELPHMSFHQLRHVNASVMASLQVPDPIAQERGGWKTDYTMKRVYTHTFTKQRKEEDMKINSYFENIIANEIANENVKRTDCNA